MGGVPSGDALCRSSSSEASSTGRPETFMRSGTCGTPSEPEPYRPVAIVWLARLAIARLRRLYSCLPVAMAAMVCLNPQQSGADAPPRQLYDFRELPVLRQTVCHQRSSYDRSGGGDDGYSGTYSAIRSEGAGSVIFDENGPGCIYRIWSSSPDGRIKVYFDGETRPTIDMPWRDMFAGEKAPFTAPFVANLLGGYVSYVPMRFAESCKIVIHGAPVRFYQITYHTGALDDLGLTVPPESESWEEPEWYEPDDYYPMDDEGAPFSPEAEPWEQEPAQIVLPTDSPRTFSPDMTHWEETEWERAAEVWRGGGLAMSVPAAEAITRESSVAPGETMCLVDIADGGMIHALDLELKSDSEHIGREAVLRMYWDGQASASVVAPVGDFFLSGFGQRMAPALPLGRMGDTYYCRLPMPFEAGARIELTNESQMPIDRLWWRVQWEVELPPVPPMGRLHACWRREAPTRDGEDFTILAVRGAGHFVGCSLTMQGLEGGGLGFLEGDEKVYVDGAPEAVDLHGTGTDHYFNGGGYFGSAASTAVYGCTLLDEAGSRCAAYRLHVTDTVPFTSGIRVTIEHGDQSQYRADYASVAYWYQAEACAAAPPLPSVAARLPGASGVRRAPDAMPAEALLPPVAQSGIRWQVRDHAELGAPVPGRCLLVECGGIGSFITQQFRVPLRGRYRFAAVLGRGPSFGVASVAIDGTPIGPPFDAYAPHPAPPTTVQFGVVPLSAGPHQVTLRAAGRNERAQGLSIGIDSFVLREAHDFVDEYLVLGPFPLHEPRDMDRDFGPEAASDMPPCLPGVGGDEGWEPMRTDQRGYLDLAANLRPRTNVVAYALCHVHSPVERDALLLLGSDDRVKLWLNGLLVHKSMAVRGASPDQDRIRVHLRAGWNALLAKVGQGTGGWGLYMRMDDPEGVYQYAARPPDPLVRTSRGALGTALRE